MRRLFVLAVLFLFTVNILSCSNSTSNETTSQPEAHVELTYSEPEIWTYGTDVSVIVYAKGIVRNVGTIPAYDVTALVTFYDSRGNILYEDDASLDKLDVNESWQYSVDYRGVRMHLDELGRARVSVTASATPDETKAKITIE